MFSLLTPDVVTMLGSSVVGFIFKQQAEKRKNEQERMKMALQAQKASDDTANNAAKRISIDAGRITRRIIVLSVLFACMYAPFLAPMFDVPIVVEVKEKAGDVLFGLFGGSEKTVFKEINGYLFAEENRQALLAIIGFYFGTASAK